MIYRAFSVWVSSVLLLLPSVSLVAQQRPNTDKLAPGIRSSLARQEQPSTQTVRVQVNNRAEFEQWAQRVLLGVELQREKTQPQLLTLSGVSRAQLEQLLASPLVTFVDVPNRVAREEQLLNQADYTVNSVTATHRRYPGLTGQGLTVSVKENSFDPTDIDFKGRLVEVNSIASPSQHATIMATLVAGGGNSGLAGKGVAWQARLTSANFANLLPDDGAQLQQRTVSVQNHSYGTGIENYYGLEAQAYDAQARQYPTLLHVFSSGNSGGQASSTGTYQGLSTVANMTGQFKMSKNTLSVGATNALRQVLPFSSRGPAYDGRVKPELVAFGADGSSDAAALVSGISLLMQQAYRNQNGGTLPPSALLKAALLNSADDTGRPEVDFVSGFGQADALGAVRTLLDGRFRNVTVTQGQEQIIRLTVPAGTQQLKATLVWTDAEAAANASRALLNDLDLELVNVTTGARWKPWTLSTYPHLDSLSLAARRRADHLNNAEQITLAAPAPGAYELRVRGYAVVAGGQAFSVAYELNSGFEWLTPTSGRNVRPGGTTQLRWQWAGPATSGQLEYRPIGGASWRQLGSAVNLAARSFAWAAPDTTTLAQVRFVTGTGTFVSDTFALAQPLPLGVGYVCSEEALLYWPRVRGATQYQLYRLGATHLEPLLLTSDTTQVLSGSALAIPQYAVAPVFQSRTTERSSSVNLSTAGFDCYIRSFIARQIVADTVQLVAELGSTFRLQSVKLQRLEQGSFRTITTLSPVTQLSLTFADPEATSGLNQYRLELQDTRGRVFYSQVESAYRVSGFEVLVFPVPAAAGTPLTIIGPTGTVLRLQLYDPLGRLMRESTANGTINSLPTEGLKPGTYLLRVGAGSNPKVTRRILILCAVNTVRLVVLSTPKSIVYERVWLWGHGQNEYGEYTLGVWRYCMLLLGLPLPPELLGNTSKV